MIDTFSERELKLATLRVAIENNALLRIVLSNQVQIMDHLKLPMASPGDPSGPYSPFDDLDPGTKVDTLNVVPLYIEAGSQASELISKKVWEWTKMKNSDSDIDPDDIKDSL